MPAVARKPEDQLTESLAACLNDEVFRRAFWTTVAPSRLRSFLPGVPCLFGQLGTSKPDLLFIKNGVPLFYVEAKLEAQTQPLQLIRARSQMRRLGARDDQLIYLAHFSDTIPLEIGWPNDALPIRAVSWHHVQQAMKAVAADASAAGQNAFTAFERLWRNLSPARSVRLKSGLRSTLQHDYGRVMHEFLSDARGIDGDFVYGSRIAPRLTYGAERWQRSFGNTDAERIWLFYGPDGSAPENYRAQLIVWHRSDIAGSDTVAREFWSLWRNSIAREPLAEFEWGGRQHTDRQRGEPPPSFPASVVGLVSLPTRRIDGCTAVRLARPELLRALRDLVAPLEQIVARVASAVPHK